MIVPFLQKFMDLWLGKGMIDVNLGYALAFVCSGSIFVLHNVNTSIGNGISYFRLQMIFMTIAAVVFIPLAYICVNITESWIGVIIANVLVLIPYEALAPHYTLKKIRDESLKASGSRHINEKI